MYHANWLKGAAGNVYSQFGEDGILARIFERIGTTTRQCFEIGAADGVWFSNTALLVKAGWRAVLIEGLRHHFVKLKQYAAEHNCVAFCVELPLNQLDEMLGVFDGEYDLGIIDIDGGDYWMWHHMTRHRPRVMCVEYACHTVDLERIPPEDSPNTTNQAGGASIRRLGEQKGYRLMCATDANMIFVRDDIDTDAVTPTPEPEPDVEQEPSPQEDTDDGTSDLAGPAADAQPGTESDRTPVHGRRNRVTHRQGKRSNRRIRRRV